MFEGFSTNTFDSGLTYLDGVHGIVDPFYGYCAGTDGNPPPIFQQYNSDGYMGTPYTVLVDKYGNILLNDFTNAYSVSEIAVLVEQALEE